MGALSDIIESLERLTAVHHAAAAPAFARAGVTETEGALLWALAHAERDLTMSEAATALDCDASNITLLARRLEGAELAERIPDAVDRRTRRLHLTDAGRRVMEEVTAALERHTPLAALTSAQRAQLRSLLDIATADLPAR